MRPPPELQADWDLLSWQARGLYSLLLIACDDLGLLMCGRAELRAVCAFVRATPSEFESSILPLLQELIAAGWLLYDAAEKLLVLPYFAASQAAVTEEALRKRAYRASQSAQSPPVPGLSRDSPGTKTPENRRENLDLDPRHKDLDKPGIYRALALLWLPCRQVLHLDLVPAFPQICPDIDGELRPPLEGYWRDCLKTYRPSDTDLHIAGQFLGERQHWQDRNSGQGVAFSFLVKPPGTNFQALLANATAWHAVETGKAPVPVGRKKGGHVRASAPAAGQAPSSDDLRRFLEEGSARD